MLSTESLMAMQLQRKQNMGALVDCQRQYSHMLLIQFCAPSTSIIIVCLGMIDQG